MGAGFSFGIILSLALTSAADSGEHALYFGSPGGSITVSGAPIPEQATSLTLEFRFKTLAKVKRSVKVVSRWPVTPKDPDKGAFFVDLSSGKILFGLRNAEGKSKTVTGRSSWRDGVWNHVAAVWDGEEAAVYLNGKRVGNQKLAGFGTLAPTKLPLRIGHPLDPKSRRPTTFEGFISDVAVWNAARDAETIAGAQAGKIAGNEPDLAAFFPLRGKAPRAVVKSPAGSGIEGKLAPSLARVGWLRTPLWSDADADRPYLHLHTYDLSSPGQPDPKSGTASVGIGDPARQILVSNESKKQAGVLWQDKASGAIHITWLDPSLGGHRTVPLQGLQGGILAAGTTDPRGNIYYLVIEKSPPNRPESVALNAKATLTDPDGKVIRETAVDMTKGQFNVYAYGGRWTGSMAYSKGTVALILPRTMYRSSDGLRHQAALAATFSPDLSQVQRLGHTSSHSFGNLFSVNSRGEFIALDLGDNYPRGVHLHRITRANKTSRIVFTFKTAHGRRPRNGSPVYPEISGNGKTFYKWSNDNGTYTELGGVVEGRASYSVIFSTDRSPEGKVLDNSRIGVRNEPRDLALLRVVKNFERASGGSEVSDAIMAWLPKGAQAETGGFYDFGGRWKKQRVTGVFWLTKYASGEAAHAPQPARRRDGKILILWEKTGPDGPSLYAMTIDETGKKITEAIRLGIDLRLAREGVPLRIGDRIFYLARDMRGRKSRLCFVNDN